MNTERNYAPNGRATTHSGQTVNSGPQPLSKPDNWQVNFLEQVNADYLQREHLFKLLGTTCDLYEGIDPVPGICLLLNYYLTECPQSIGRESHQLAAVVRLIHDLTRLRAEFGVLDQSTKYTDRMIDAEGEGGQDND